MTRSTTGSTPPTRLEGVRTELSLPGRDGSACAEFSWEGFDDNEPACGRGWVMLGTAGRLAGHLYIHKGDDSGFVCERD